MDRSGAYHAIYDEQCEICQSGVSWLRALDLRHRVVPVPIDPENLSLIHKNLEVDACLKELHVVKPDGQIVVGWEAVATLARLFPATWVIGAVGTIPGCRFLFRTLYRFWTIIYDGVAVDPGSPRMRRSLLRHLRRIPSDTIRAIATHHHEEHSGNLNWLADLTQAKLYVPPLTSQLLSANLHLPWARRFIIGEPPRLRAPFEVMLDRIPTTNGHLEVLASPGHCNDHVVLYDPQEKLLIVADAFMGIYFSAPNPDVDSRRWIDTLERMLQLDIEILIEGHGLIHTERQDIPDIPGVVVRRNPKTELGEKLLYLKWIQSQIQAGFSEGLPIYAVEATCFPWGRSHAWEGFINDNLMRIFSLGHWSRTELIRSFVRPEGSDAVLPLVYQARIFAAPSKKKEDSPPEAITASDRR